MSSYFNLLANVPKAFNKKVGSFSKRIDQRLPDTLKNGILEAQENTMMIEDETGKPMEVEKLSVRKCRRIKRASDVFSSTMASIPQNSP